MVAIAEQNVASKTPRKGISGLTLEPVRNVHGVEALVLGPGQNLIGSSSDCSHILRANGVQPRHCEIRIDAGRATLRALDFRTWLNNGPVRQVEIHVGDRLTVGPLEFRISSSPAGEDANFQPAEVPVPSGSRTVAAPAASVSVPPAIPDHVIATLQRQKEAEARLAETENRLLQQADEIQSRLRSLESSEEGLSQKLARIHEQELALARRSAVVDPQPATARITPARTTPATVVPDFVAQATQRQAEQEARLAQREAQLERETAELNVRATTLADCEDQLAERLSQIYEQELALARRTAMLDAQAATARVAPQSQSSPTSAIPDSVAQAAKKQAEEEGRLAHRAAQLEQEAVELQSRSDAVAASEEQLAQRLSQIHEQELALVRQSAMLEAQAADARVTPQVQASTSQAIPLAMEAAVPRMSNVLAMQLFHFTVAPHGSLISRPSTSLPFGHAVGGPQRIDPGARSQPRDILLAPTFHYTGDDAIAIHQKQCRHMRDAVGITGREAALFGIEQHGEGEPVFRGERVCVIGVIL